MGNYAVNKGNQQVTIYPYQDLTSYNVNQLLYGLIGTGFFEGSVSIFDGGSLGGEYTNAQVVFRVNAGSSLTFIRSYLVESETKKFVGKVVLESHAYLPITKTTLWKSSGYMGANSIIISADWNYSLENPTERYVNFEILTDVQKQDCITNGKIILAEFLNHPYLVNNCGTQEPNYPAVSVTSYQRYYPEIEGQSRRIFKRLEEQSKRLPVNFSYDGNKILVGPGVVWCTDTILYLPTAMQSPPVPLRASIPPGHTASEYYQIDILRLIHNEEPYTPTLVWDSFLKEKPSPTWNFGDITNISQSDILNFISGYKFSVYNDGFVILIGVRECWNIPTSGPTTTTLWPGQCYIPDFYMPHIGTSDYVTRFRLPVYTDL